MSGGFASLHPLVCAIYYAGALTLGMLFFHPLYLLFAVVILVLLNIAHDGGKRLRRQGPFYALMAGSVVLLNPLFSHRGSHILFYLFGQPVTLEAIGYGVVMSLSLLVILLVFLSFQQVITTEKWMYLFASFAPRTALLTTVAIRFVPLFKRRLQQITLVQRTKGIDVRTGKLGKRMRDGMTLMRVLVTWSLEEALQTADSMKARGYGTGPRSHYVIYRMERRDRNAMLFLLVTAVLCAGGWTQGLGVLQIYPHLETMRMTWGDGALLFCYSAFLLLPVYIEREERSRWN